MPDEKCRSAGTSWQENPAGTSRQQTSLPTKGAAIKMHGAGTVPRCCCSTQSTCFMEYFRGIEGHCRECTDTTGRRITIRKRDGNQLPRKPRRACRVLYPGFISLLSVPRRVLTREKGTIELIPHSLQRPGTRLDRISYAAEPFALPASRLHCFAFCITYFAPHLCIASRMGLRLSPVCVSEYSTRGGTSG